MVASYFTFDRFFDLPVNDGIRTCIGLHDEGEKNLISWRVGQRPSYIVVVLKGFMLLYQLDTVPHGQVRVEEIEACQVLEKRYLPVLNSRISILFLGQIDQHAWICKRRTLCCVFQSNHRESIRKDFYSGSSR